jgi:hypothetical protein
MALYTVGNRQTVSKEGITDTILYPGDIVEFYLVPSKSLNKYNAFLALLEAFKMKNKYPELVIHYLNLDTNLITVQCSIAPPEKGVSGSVSSRSSISGIASPLTGVQVAVIIAICIAFIAAIVGFTVYYQTKIRYETWLKTGNLSLSAIGCDNSQCTSPYSLEAPYSVADYSGTTPAVIKDLRTGDYTITWGAISGYQTPSPSVATVVAGQTIEVPPAKYFKQGVIPPTTGWIVVDTSPVKGTVYIDAQKIGTAPIKQEVEVGDYTVSFGDIEKYETPPAQRCHVAPGDTVHISGTYIPTGGGFWDWWESLPDWAKGIIVATIGIGGAALAVGAGIQEARKKER